MRLLNLAEGKFIVYTTCNDKYNVYVQRKNGRYHCYGNVTEERLDELIKAWNNIMYIYK